MMEAVVRLDLRVLLGHRVEVVIDWPLGSGHSHHPDLVYPVNYRYPPAPSRGMECQSMCNCSALMSR